MSLEEINSPSMRNRQLVIGLTGGIGSGKTLVANRFAEHGASVIDSDVIARTLTAPGGAAIEAIRNAFGAGMITAHGSMDRAKMRTLVFSDAQQKKRLESILHPMIFNEARRQSTYATGLYVIVVIPLLVETGRWQQWNLTRVLVVDCDERVQLQRVIERDGLPANMVKSIMTQQASRAQRLAIANDVVQNHTDLSALDREIDRLHAFYCQLAISINKSINKS